MQVEEEVEAVEAIHPIAYDIVEVDGSAIIGDQIYLQRKRDGMLLLVQLTPQIRNLFLPDSATTFATHNVQLPRSWSAQAIRLLINCVKIRMNEFQSTTVKNDRVWQGIAEEMAQSSFGYSSVQCKDKYKYLKSKYMKKKDNMSDRASGAECIKFEYFEEMDEFLGHRHNAKPIALASNLLEREGIDNSASDSTVLEESENETEPPRKKMMTKAPSKKSESAQTKLYNEICENANRREESNERRHRESLESRHQALEVFSNKMDDLLRILANKK